MSILVVDNAFVATLAHTTWAHDRTCPYSAGLALAGCEIGDDLGFVAIELALLPLLLTGTGVVGGAIGVATTAGRRCRRPPSRAARPPGVRRWSSRAPPSRSSWPRSP